MHSLATDKVYKLILLIGQSGALGQSTVYTNLSGAYADYHLPHRVRMAQQLQCNSDSKAAACATEHAVFNVGRRSHTQGQFGPEIGICRAVSNIETWAAPGNTIIVKCATGATDLANDWDPAAIAGYMLYSRMIEFIQNPRQLWAASYEVAGASIIHGEADAQILAEANAYEPGIAAFCSSLRTDVGKPTLPIALQKLHTGYTLGAYHATVRAAQVAVATADENITIVEDDDVPLGDDDVHTTENGCAVRGVRHGAALDAYYPACGGA